MPAYHVVTPEGKVGKASRQEVRALKWLPVKVEIPLRRIAEAARQGLMALCVQVGLAVLQATMENEVAERVGPRGKHRADRQAYRHGHGSPTTPRPARLWSTWPTNWRSSTRGRRPACARAWRRR